MQLPSSLVSVAESAVQNAQEAGYLQSWPNEVVEQFHYVSALSNLLRKPFTVTRLSRSSYQGC